jgi:hypothetical protein
MSLLDAYRTAHFDQAFQGLVRMALLAQSLAVLQEDEATPNHAARLAMAKRLLAVPSSAFLDGMVERACEVLALGGLDGSSPEVAIVAAIAANADLISTTFAPEAP